MYLPCLLPMFVEQHYKDIQVDKPNFLDYDCIYNIHYIMFLNEQRNRMPCKVHDYKVAFHCKEYNRDTFLTSNILLNKKEPFRALLYYLRLCHNKDLSLSIFNQIIQENGLYDKLDNEIKNLIPLMNITPSQSAAKIFLNISYEDALKLAWMLGSYYEITNDYFADLFQWAETGDTFCLLSILQFYNSHKVDYRKLKHHILLRDLQPTLYLSLLGECERYDKLLKYRTWDKYKREDNNFIR